MWHGKYGSINDKMDCHDLLCKGRTGLNTDFKLKNAASSTQKHIKQDSTTHSNTSKKNT